MYLGNILEHAHWKIRKIGDSYVAYGMTFASYTEAYNRVVFTILEKADSLKELDALFGETLNFKNMEYKPLFHEMFYKNNSSFLDEFLLVQECWPHLDEEQRRIMCSQSLLGQTIWHLSEDGWEHILFPDAEDVIRLLPRLTARVNG